MARGRSRLLSASVLASAVLAVGAAPGDWAACATEECGEDAALLQRLRPAERAPSHAHQHENHTCLARASAAATPGEVGQFQLRVLNYDNSWHVRCKASRESLLLDPFFPGQPGRFFGPLLALELEPAGSPGIPIDSIESDAIVLSLESPDHANLQSLSALLNRTRKVPVLAAREQSAKGGLHAALLDEIGYDDYAGLAALSTLYPDCSPNAEGDLQFRRVGDFRVCYAGKSDSAVVRFRTALIASSCGVILHAPHGVEGPFSQNMVRAISKLRIGKHLVAIIGTSSLRQFGVPLTQPFATVREVVRQIRPDAFFDTHRQEYFAISGIAWDLLHSSVFRVDRLAPEDICNAFPDTYRGSPSNIDNPLQVPVYGQP